MARKKFIIKNPSASTLATSSLHIHFEALKTEHQWLLKQIKRKRTEVNNFVEQMRAVAMEMFQRTSPIYQKASKLDQEIHDLFTEILANNSFSKRNKQKIEEIYETLQGIGLISPRFEDEEDEDKELDEMFEFEEEESQRYYERETQENDHNFEESNTRNISKNIRHIFLKLAEKFHPDKVTDAEAQTRHTEIMKEINRAYKEGDLARLLEIEKNHESEEILFAENEDDQTRQCKRLEHENEILKEQYEHLKYELQLAKNTPEGEMVKQYRKAKREQIDMIGEMIKVMELELKALTELKNFVLNFKNKKMSIKEFLKGPKLRTNLSKKQQEEMMEEMLEELINRVYF